MRIKLFLLFFILVSVVNGQDIENFSTELPLIVINTEGKTILDEPKITANMKIIHNPESVNTITDDANEYDGFVGIEIRGRSSSHYPQKPYLFETRNEDGSNNNVSILGLPEENDWILLSNYNDKSLMRNILGYQLFERLGNYAPRARLVEVILNNEYQGIYILTEKIKRDKNRVDIAKLKEDDISGEELTGGYIFKIDYWNNNDSWQSPYSPINHPYYNIHFVYHDPDWDELTWQQKDYLEDYVTSFEETLYGLDYNHAQNGYSKYIDTKSFIDYFIVSEVSRNNDGFKKSRYFHKDKNGKIVAGPVWDFDWAWKNINECYIFKATDGSGWSYKVNNCNPDVKSPDWMVRLFYDPEFKSRTNCRYYDVRSDILSNEAIFATIDSLYNLVKAPQIKHFQRWNILGRNVGAPEVDEQPDTYEGEVEKLKTWITKRLDWLDSNMPGTCTLTNIIENTTKSEIVLWPNPATNYFKLKSPHNIKEVQIYDLTGRLKKTLTTHSAYVNIDINELETGLYMVKSKLTNGDVVTLKLMKK